MSPLQPAPEWTRRAACADAEPETFFPDPGQDTLADRAKAICARCRVSWQCMEYAIANNEHGVWGGTTYMERRRLRAERERQAS